MDERNAARALGLVQSVVGLATLVAPQRTARTLLPHGADIPDVRIVRVLGLRQLTQGVVVARWPQPPVVRLGAAVDAVHAASLVPIVARSPRYRVAAGTSAGMATAAALAGWLISRRDTGRTDGSR